MCLGVLSCGYMCVCLKPCVYMFLCMSVLIRVLEGGCVHFWMYVLVGKSECMLLVFKCMCECSSACMWDCE